VPFALAPSLGHGPRAIARRFAELLATQGSEPCLPNPTWPRGGLLEGGHTRPGAAVCAKVEAAGGIVALQALRHGAATYRPCSSVWDHPLTSGAVQGPGGYSAAWVDSWSMGGSSFPGRFSGARVDFARAFFQSGA
jgi:hypothetical protein